MSLRQNSLKTGNPGCIVRCFSALFQQVSLLYGDVIMSAMGSQISGLTIVYATVYSGANQRKHQSSAPLAFVRGIYRWPVNSPHKGPVTRKMFPFDDVIIQFLIHDFMWDLMVFDLFMNWWGELLSTKWQHEWIIVEGNISMVLIDIM